MTREIDADFKLLKSFLNDYSLRAITENADNLCVVKAAHKAYLPFLHFWSICLNESAKGNFYFFEKKVSPTSIEFSHLQETVSDTGSGLFCCLHGAYKPGHMALRSSIENFVRFASAPFDSNAITTTSVYNLFILARETKPFAGAGNFYLGKLREKYVDLCKYSHSASLAHMAGIHALAHFPSFDDAAFLGWLELAKSCISAMATVVVQGHPSFYLNANYTSRELLEQLIPKHELLTLLGGAREGV